MPKPKTQLREAIDNLRAACGGRPFFLIVEKTHADAPAWSTIIATTEALPTWQALGLVRHAQLSLERQEYGDTLPPEWQR